MVDAFGLGEKKWNSIQEEHSAISLILGKSYPFIQLGGGFYRATLPTYSDGDIAGFHFSQDGRLLVDTELTLSGVTIDNVKTFATANTAATTNYAYANSDAVAYTGNMPFVGIGGYDVTNSKFQQLRLMKGDTVANAGFHVSVAGEVVDFDAGAGTDYTPAMGLLVGASGGAQPMSIYAPNTIAMSYGLMTMPARYLATPIGITDTYSVPLLVDNYGKLIAATKGEYVAVTNALPANIGIIVNTNAAAPDATTQSVRTTGGVSAATITSANFWGLDSRAKLYGKTSGGVTEEEIYSVSNSLKVTTVGTNKPAVTNATGAVAINTTTAVANHFKLSSITCHFDVAPVASENFVVKVDALDGAVYDTVLFSVDPSATSSTDIAYVPDGELLLESGDEIVVTFANTNLRTYGLRIVTEVV